MFPLFETLAIEKGQICHLAYHQTRYEQSLKQFYAQSAVNIYDFSDIIHIPTALLATSNAPLIRCRIDYNHQAYQVRYFPYQRKPYRTFQPVICNEIEYGLKYANRQLLNHLFEQRNGCDEIIIIKHGYVTDCSIGNLIFRQGKQWLTPSTPLLKGTQRAYLLAQGKIKERSILQQDLAQFEEVRLINALNGL